MASWRIRRRRPSHGRRHVCYEQVLQALFGVRCMVVHEEVVLPVPVQLSIAEIQRVGVTAPDAGGRVTTQGVVTGHSRKGFFIQSGTKHTGASVGIFVYSPNLKLTVGCEVAVVGDVVDYRASTHDKPCTQIALATGKVLRRTANRPEVVWLDTEILGADAQQTAALLNGLESMLVGVKAGARFVAPSNSFGDYVVVPGAWPGVRSPDGGILIDAAQPNRWLPSFRVLDYSQAPCVDVGATLESDVIGPLNYRAAAYQIVAVGGVAVSPPRQKVWPPTTLGPEDGHIRVMTVNGFNLDPHVESKRRVADPGRGVDDDVGTGRFDELARAVVDRGRSPEVVALQEIQDEDGAEQSSTIAADTTFSALAASIRRVGGPDYSWADVPPEAGMDGGQPGGNIRNGFLYDPARVELVADSLARLGSDHSAFVASRKPIVAEFAVRPASRRRLRVVNVHLTSKRHQRGVFAPEQPGYDPKHEQRIAQGRFIAELVERSESADYYVTGDFNDFEFSDTLRVVCGQHSINMVDRLPAAQRYDYNHRGKLQVLMHGVVSKQQAREGRVEYEILHGNELVGASPGGEFEKASDHAYVIARFRMSG